MAFHSLGGSHHKAAIRFLSCLVAVPIPTVAISETTPTAFVRFDHENPSTVKALVQSITQVSGFHFAIAPYQPSISSTGKNAELMKIKTKIRGKREFTTSCEPVFKAIARRKLPTAIDRYEVMNISDNALGAPPVRFAPKM